MNTRREFIRKLSAPFLALPAANASAWACSVKGDRDGRVLKVALMGLGGYANRVAEAMRDCKRARVTGLISGTPSKIRDWRSRYGIPEANCYDYSDFDRIRDNPDIDAIYVITPNALHRDHTVRSAKAGKHVICEKPMAVNAAEAAEMADTCRRQGVKLLVGYRMHFESNTLEIVRMRNAGELGKVLFFQGLSGFALGNPNQWRLKRELSGGGALMDIGIYSVNGARYMVGEEPVWVTAQETKTDPVKFPAGVDETITFQLGFPGGAVASCLSTYAMSNLDRFFLNGTKGFAELQPATGYGPILGRTHKGALQLPHRTHQTVQMDEMAAMILDDRKTEIPLDGEEGLKDMRILDAIYEAAKTGKKIDLKS
jgi:predicted dehydrogenase